MRSTAKLTNQSHYPNADMSSVCHVYAHGYDLRIEDIIGAHHAVLSSSTMA
jgi:hypothetical protein